jgi:hypothetical protein
MVQGFYALTKQAQETGDLTTPIVEPGLCLARLPRPGTFHVNATRVLGADPLDARQLSRAETTARRQVDDLVGFMRAYLPGFQDAYLARTAAEIGVRESRRIVGEYRLTMDDIETGRDFPDAVTRNKWAHSDTHSNQSMQWSFHFVEGPYHIPARCLIPVAVDNLLVAGRCISVDRGALASVRIQPIATETGQAAGVMAALAARAATRVRDVDIQEVRRQLQAAGVVLSTPH